MKKEEEKTIDCKRKKEDSPTLTVKERGKTTFLMGQRCTRWIRNDARIVRQDKNQGEGLNLGIIITLLIEKATLVS